MKCLVCLALVAAGTMMVHAQAMAAGTTVKHFDLLVARIHKASTTALQSTYSKQLRKSVNAAAVKNVEQGCARRYRRDKAQTFTLAGIMRLDGVLKAAVPLPDTPFTRCMSNGMQGLTFPLPPGNQTGWPVAVQFNGSSGKVLYTAGDRQPAMPLYKRTVRAINPWLYTPVPLVPAKLGKSCKVSVWLSVDVQGRVTEVDPNASTCPSRLSKAVMAAAGQWIYVGTGHARRSDSLDVRLSFALSPEGVRVKL